MNQHPPNAMKDPWEVVQKQFFVEFQLLGYPRWLAQQHFLLLTYSQISSGLLVGR
jgi:hypothetical protein